MTSTSNHQAASPGILIRFLRLFAPVGPGEGQSVLLLALNVFILLTAYYIIKPVREALILSEWSAETKIIASAGQALLLLGAVPLYSQLADRLPSRRLISTVLLFFAICLGVFYVAAKMGLAVGIAFYLWVGVFNLMVVAQFWSFANDLYTPDQGKRLFAIVGFGSSAGAVFGSFITGRLIGSFGLHQMLLLSGVLLLVSLALTRVTRTGRAESPAGDQVSTSIATDKPLEGPGGFALVLRNRYLLMIGVMLVLANLVNTTGEYILSKRVEDRQEAAIPLVERTAAMSEVEFIDLTAQREDEVGVGIGRFYAGFFSIVNLASMLIQLFLVSRIVGWIGVRRAVTVLPLVAMGGYALMALFPALGVARWVKTAENSTDYSLQNTVRQMLFLPTSREEKYKAKQAIDTFFVRMGDVLAALLVIGGITLTQLGPSEFALVNIGLAGVWMVLAVAIGRRFARMGHTDSQ